MLHFRQTVLSQIKSASDEKEIENIIRHSIQRLKSKNINGHIIQRFIQAMDKTLDQARLEDTSEKAEQNMDIAIGMFRKLQRP
ncbi:hypothetical protein SAMN04488109_1755 [Chryseolinea serpens]|uniref:Glutamyl-tRNA reductase n=1 Tax=Chryseolinea serpens TaxID=947013 RepID=A0A1M5MI54_9BACT|nr:hypothetical protein [Chryseolinea serpens]SHG76936.1 hypothetical protein SAMN04488109_1755 [Chryseolinea serpens]